MEKSVENGVVWLTAIMAFLILFAAMMCASAGILWAGWNWLVVPAFHAPRCTFLQALAAGFLLSTISSVVKSSSK